MPPSAPSEACGPALAVRDLQLAYGRGGDTVVVLDLPAFDVPAGACVGITGPSGSGKSSLIHVLTGIETATGRVAWGDIDIGRLGESARDAWRLKHVGLLFQNFHLVPRLSAIENVLLPFRFDHASLAPDLRRQSADLLDRVGIAHHHRAAAVLSRGEQQRVALARALVRRPSILVADEPTASLDPEAGETVTDLLLGAAGDTGATTLVVSHDPRVLARLPQVHRLVAGRLASPGMDVAA